ncbi:MAG: nitrite/sulfite reductase [Chloroflexi bacterium]|nr:nitrite/sulfite reductase [Chloroflexota bacterium]
MQEKQIAFDGEAAAAIDPLSAAEIARFAELIGRRRRGEVDEEDFRRFRLQHGIYGIRNQVDVQMVRVKIPQGVLSAQQLDCMGEIAQSYARSIGHLTTRQDVQFHWVPLDTVPDILHRLAKVGLTTREAAGNIVRNVTACPLAGVCTQEVFDVTPAAAALARHLLRNPLCQALPRKFKMAFSGCATDCAATGIHDLGALATCKEEDGRVRLGFRLYVGGGLGAAPHTAQLLEPFTPSEDLILTVVAILRVYDRLGNRQNRARARLKFLVADLGIEEFRRLVFEERRIVWATWAGELPGAPPELTVTPAAPEQLRVSSQPTPAGFGIWRKTNVVAQKQAGFYIAYVMVPGGDLTAAQFHALAAILRQFPGLEVRTTITQDLVVRWVPGAWLPALYVALAAADLGRPGVHHIGNVVSCPGADTCNLALTHSHRLAQELTRRFAERPDLGLAEDLRDVTIKVSGCPNSCGQHLIATIGLYGAARKAGDRQVPSYQLLLGGEVHDGRVSFGRLVMRLPAKRVPEAIFRIIELYRSDRRDGESFLEWIRRKEVSDGLDSIAG